MFFTDDDITDFDEFDEEHGEDIEDKLFDRVHPYNKCFDLITRVELLELEEEPEEIV